ETAEAEGKPITARHVEAIVNKRTGEVLAPDDVTIVESVEKPAARSLGNTDAPHAHSVAEVRDAARRIMDMVTMPSSKWSHIDLRHWAKVIQQHVS
ncbi:MAG: hypothetical protein VKL39_24465, partial [Leptolyngbyaceae bacterium]|nr:hypothetical protein [Leptolyngbyaceae bacterium]